MTASRPRSCQTTKLNAPVLDIKEFVILVVHEKAPRRAKLLSGGFFFTDSVERLGLQLAALLHEDFDFTFRGLQLLPAGVGQANAFFKQLQRFLQRKVSAF